MKILGIECTAAPVSCALYEDGKFLGVYFLNQKVTHSQTLLPMVESVLKLSNINLSDIDVIAVTAGPGSFTGVRIGISAVKGLCFADNKPCIPVSVLEAMAYNLIGQECIVCSTMDARCNQVYNAIFKVRGESVERLCDDRALMIDELYDNLKGIKSKYSNAKIIVVGDGADLFYNAIKDKDKELNINLAVETQKWQNAAGVCLAAKDRAIRKETISNDELLPVYLRLPQAERELKSKQQCK